MSENIPPTSPFPLTVEIEAIEQLVEVAETDDIPKRLRIAISGGGCSGFQYEFNFDDQILEDDLISSFGEMEVVVDPISALYLQGAVLGWKQDINGERFEMRNPLATRTCGCGSSFSVD